jgi:hypothetical protein
MSNKEDSEDFAAALSREIGFIVVLLAMTALRAYVLSICVGWLFPMVALSFWQWTGIVYTIRLLIAPPPSRK